MIFEYRDLSKFVWVGRLLRELNNCENGFELQRRILTELCRFINIPDKIVTSLNVEFDNLRRLKQLATKNKFEIEKLKRNTMQEKCGC